VTDPGRWLDARLADAPASLREGVLAAVRRALPDGGTERFHEMLAERADALIASATVSASPAAPAAASLLAADALMTLACEWVAEHDPARLGELR